MSAAEAVRRSADAGSKAWIDLGRRTLRFSELDERIQRMAALLAARGVSLGDRVVIASRDDAETALNFVALVANGVTAINIDAETAEPRAKALIARSAPRLLIVDGPLADSWELSPPERVIRIEPAPAAGKLLGGLLRKTPASGFHAELAAAGTSAPPAEIPPETIAYILFTSGTTQQPKGVCISHRALFAHLATLTRIYGCGENSIILNTLMLSHADGIAQGPMLAWVNCATLHRPFPFEIGTIDHLLDAVYRLRVTHMIAVPTMLALMTRLVGKSDAFQGGDFRLMVSCGAALEAELWTRVEQCFGVSLINVYGLTETVAGGVFAGEIVGARHPGSIGVPIDCELRIVDENGCDVGVDDTGELLIRGDLLLSGYFEDPALTAATMVDGWFHTGDLASRDAAGIYWVRGRIKNIVIRGGYNISPEEIVEALNRHPAVRESVAFGIADPDWGEQLVALTVTNGVDEAELHRHAQGLLEPRKLPNRILIVDALPHGRSGKVVIDDARALYERSVAQPQPATGAGEDDPGNDAERVLAIAASAFRTQRDELTLDATPDDVFGWDSMAHMEFVVALEQEFGISLSPSVVLGLDRLSKALDAVRAG